jgi:Protein of unknown function (DUF4232)
MTTTEKNPTTQPSSQSALFTGAREHSKRRRIKAAFGAGLALVLLVVAAIVGSVMTSGPKAANTGAPLVSNLCTGSKMFASVEGTTTGAGSFATLIVMKYVGQKTCDLTGFPAIAAVENGKVTEVAYNTTLTSHNGMSGGLKAGAKLPGFNLEPGHLASFWIEGSDEQAGATADCHASTGMQITIGGVPVTPLQVRTPLNWCNSFYVLPLTAGQSGSFPARTLKSFFG